MNLRRKVDRRETLQMEVSY